MNINVRECCFCETKFKPVVRWQITCGAKDCKKKLMSKLGKKWRATHKDRIAQLQKEYYVRRKERGAPN